MSAARERAMILLVYAAIGIGAFLYVIATELLERASGRDTVGIGYVAFPAVSYSVARMELVCRAGNGAELRIRASEILLWSERSEGSTDCDCLVVVRNRPAVYLPRISDAIDVRNHLMQLAAAKRVTLE